MEYSAEEVREYASELEGENSWYRTPQEENILQLQKGSEERQKKLKAKSRYGDISLVLFPAFNPDKFLTWLYARTAYFYTTWFTALTLLVFAFTAGITISHWGEIGRDTLEFYNFSDKTWGDVVVFYLLAVVTSCPCLQTLRRARPRNGFPTTLRKAMSPLRATSAW